MTVRVLVTGVGGVIGQGLVRSLRLSGHDCIIMAADADPMSAGIDMADETVMLPYASDAGYIDEVAAVCEARGVGLLLPGIYQDACALSPAAAYLEERCGTKVVVSGGDVLARTEDKWETHLFLCESGLNCCRTVKGDDAGGVGKLVGELGFPLVLKKRNGHGSKGFYVVRDEREMEYLLSREDGVIVQEYLRPDEHEYTCGVFTGADGSIWGTIALRRRLACGLTYKAEVSFDKDVIGEAEKAVKALRPSGPCNVQLRLTEDGPFIFEINARFSSSTSIRARFGFNEAGMSVDSFLLGRPAAQPEVRGGVALRYWDEVVRYS